MALMVRHRPDKPGHGHKTDIGQPQDGNRTIIDVRGYLAPNYSYDAIIKAYKCKLGKGCFPFDKFDHYDKIK